MARKKLKVVMLGEGRVGKTSLLHRFINNTFDEECVSTQKATMYANTKVEVGDTTADVSIWDTAGQERYHALGPIYYRDAHGAVLAYDITDKDSFDKVKVWLKELHQVVGENIQVVVVGNKIDLERERKVPKKDAEEWAAQHNAQHFQCSAKLGLKVSDAFTSLVKTIVEKLPAEGSSKTRERGGTTASSSTAASSGPPPPRSKGVKIAPIEEAPAQKQNNGDKCAC
jgi:Ras-related protein Rab-21